MSAAGSFLSIGQLVGSYRVVRSLGEGAMGEVYEVHDGTLDRRAALKVVPPAMARDKGVVARFRREARAASQVRHAGVVHIFEYGVLPEPVASPYFIMEYLEGETLHARLKRAAQRPGGCLGLSCLPILRQIAIALAAVHRRGLVHRDLKPARRTAVDGS
jgi:serine/threonine protein kinase